MKTKQMTFADISEAFEPYIEKTIPIFELEVQKELFNDAVLDLQSAQT